MSMPRAQHDEHHDPVNDEAFKARAEKVASELSGPRPPSSRPPSRRHAVNHWPKLVEDQREMIIAERGGVLFVEEHGGVFWDGSAGLGRARSQGLGGEVICRFPFANLHKRDPGNQETPDADDPDLAPSSRLLQTADRLLIGRREPGLRAWDHEAGQLGETAAPVKKGRILLVLPGMFVNGETLMEQMREASSSFLDRTVRHYDQILVFDYFSLSNSPLLSAVKIAGLVKDSDADIDVICHGRGSLIARWWLQGLPPCGAGERRTILIGPDMGQHLFSPHRLCSTLNLLINLARMQDSEETSSALLTVAMAVFVMVSSVSSLNARPPIVRAALASIPSIAPPCSNLAHLDQTDGEAFPICCAITSDFALDDQNEAYWPFWHYLLDRHFKFERADSRSAINEPIFSQPNDLLAQGERNIEKMRHQCKLHHNFQPCDNVHHFNYLDQSTTYDMIMKSLKIS